MGGQPGWACGPALRVEGGSRAWLTVVLHLGRHRVCRVVGGGIRGIVVSRRNGARRRAREQVLHLHGAVTLANLQLLVVLAHHAAAAEEGAARIAAVVARVVQPVLGLHCLAQLIRPPGAEAVQKVARALLQRPIPTNTILSATCSLSGPFSA